MKLSVGHKIVILIGVCIVSTSAFAQDKPIWRVAWANDEIVGSDNQFTNGAFLQKSSILADSLEQAGGTPAFGKGLASLVLPKRAGLFYRETWTVGQNLQTPDRISERDIILTDVPYVSMLGWTNSHIAFNDQELTGFQTLLGWVGDLTLGEETQSLAHDITGATDPKGWDNQLDNEPLLNLYVMRKAKFYNNDWMDAAWNLDAALGNFFTLGQAALEFRFGNRPAGFAPVGTPIGRSMDYNARILDPGVGYFYTSAIVRGTGLLFALPRDGNLLRDGNDWTDDEQLDTKNLLGQLILGLHYETLNWGAHLNVFLATDSAEANNGSNLEDPSNNFAILSVEWTF
ncbi:MAG: lipid A deacylase LpxR family protein [Wenzhouxiangellaceae bacterium]|nr:lipid A deacylase LpxR family protein [Wenzhouxiangellaceae bacterium]